jgi:WD40-like Beta Propeller Repeat
MTRTWMLKGCKSAFLVAALTFTTLLGGCATVRTVTVTAKPADARLIIEGIDRGAGPITQQFTFNDPNELKVIRATRPGYEAAEKKLSRDWTGPEVALELKPQKRRINVQVQPAPAFVKVNGTQVQELPTNTPLIELDVVDAKGSWATYTITAERPNFVGAAVTVSMAELQPYYVLKMDPYHKNLEITTTPDGASVYLDDTLIGTSPARPVGVEFPVDLDSNEFIPKHLKAVKPGYAPVESLISWDDGKQDYHVEFSPYGKTVHIATDPSDGVVTIDGKELKRDSNGTSIGTFQFPPINDKGDLKTYKAVAMKKTGDREWYPQEFTLAWDSGRTDYSIPLPEVLTKPVALISTEIKKTDDGWDITPEQSMTVAMRDTKEGSNREPPLQLTHLAKGSQIGTLTLSPDGSQLLFTVLTGTTKSDFRSQMMVVRTDGNGGEGFLTDGKTLDLMPTYKPAGDQIVFSSNRFGRRLTICSMAANGAAGIQSLTSGDTNDLWPTVDSDPRERLFYEALIDTRTEPRLLAAQIGTTLRVDLTPAGGTQPRVSPKNDSIIYCAVNEKTGKRDIYRVSADGGMPQNLTNTPDVDEFDPAWSKDGSRIAFVSDRGVDQEKKSNYDIWMINLASPENPTQVTTNGSQDDSPVWDVAGTHIYFRSNRGGEWGIWKISVR